MDWTIGKDWTKDTPPGQNWQHDRMFSDYLDRRKKLKKLRIEYVYLVTQALHDLEGVSLDWDTVATMKSCAFKIFGPTPQRNPLPWLQGKERELLALRNTVHHAEEKLRKARANKQSDCQKLLIERRQTSKALLSQKKIWEAKWWDDLADKAQVAGDNNNEFTFWQVCKTLGFRETRRFHQVVKRTVADPEEDKEAWKDSLSSIQKDKGEVSSLVWDLIPVVPQPHTDLANPPTWKEYQIALNKMHFGKRGGIDDATVELIRFGGERLQSTVFDVVCSMWTDAAQAPPGHEADNWPSYTTTGICIPVFKNKGC